MQVDRHQPLLRSPIISHEPPVMVESLEDASQLSSVVRRSTTAVEDDLNEGHFCKKSPTLCFSCNNLSSPPERYAVKAGTVPILLYMLTRNPYPAAEQLLKIWTKQSSVPVTEKILKVLTQIVSQHPGHIRAAAKQ